LAHLAAEAASLVMLWTPDDENLTPERPMRLDPQETFAKRDETRNVQNSVGIQIVKLNPISEKVASKERMLKGKDAGGARAPRGGMREKVPESPWVVGE
jgi:hypothetical protein